RRVLTIRRQHRCTLLPYTTLFRSSIHPYLAAVLMSVPVFFFVRLDMKSAELAYMIGVLPVALALVMLVLLVRALRIAPTISLSRDRKSTRLHSSHQIISSAVFCSQ